MNGQITSFGTTGYTLRNVFLIYDRLTQSVWYPLADGAMDAIGGPRLGDRIPFIEKPPIMPLAQWLKGHPDSKVLYADRSSLQKLERRLEKGAMIRLQRRPALRMINQSETGL